MPDEARLPIRDDLASLEASGFAFPGPLRDQLTALAKGVERLEPE